MAARTLVYLAYGNRSIVDEAIFSLLSAFRFIRPGRKNLRFVVYTDQPERFSGMRVIVEKLADTQIKSWMGPHKHGNRVKHQVLLHALEKYQGRVVLMDTDTYFQKSPDLMFQRIGPGHSLMHLWEGFLGDPPDWSYFRERLLRMRPVNGHPATVRTSMWNGGVVGLDHADRKVLQEIIDLNDQLFSRGVHLAHQLSTSIVLARRTLVRACSDVVFHYWPPEYRRPFKERLESLLPSLEGKHEREQTRTAYKYRVKPPRHLRVRHLAKAVLQTFGFYYMRPAIRSNFEPFAGGIVRILRAQILNRDFRFPIW